MQPRRIETQLPTERDQQVAIGAYHVRHALAVEAVPMEPHPSVECMAHSIKPPGEFPGGYEQEMLPSMVAEPIAAALPEKTKHCLGVLALTAVADHPSLVASFTVMVTPGVVVKLLICARVNVYFALS